MFDVFFPTCSLRRLLQVRCRKPISGEAACQVTKEVAQARSKAEEAKSEFEQVSWVVRPGTTRPTGPEYGW